MSDLRHMHEYFPSRRGTCKQIIGSAICGQSEEFGPHQRYAQWAANQDPTKPDLTEEHFEQFCEATGRDHRAYSNKHLFLEFANWVRETK